MAAFERHLGPSPLLKPRSIALRAHPNTLPFISAMPIIMKCFSGLKSCERQGHSINRCHLNRGRVSRVCPLWGLSYYSKRYPTAVVPVIALKLGSL